MSVSEPLQSTQVPLRSHQFSEHHLHPSTTPPAKRSKVLTSTSPVQSPLPAQQREGGNATGGNATGGSATGGNSIGSYAKATGGNAKATGGNATVYNLYNVTAIGGKATGGGATGGEATGGGATGGGATGGGATGRLTAVHNGFRYFLYRYAAWLLALLHSKM